MSGDPNESAELCYIFGLYFILDFLYIFLFLFFVLYYAVNLFKNIFLCLKIWYSFYTFSWLLSIIFSEGTVIEGERGRRGEWERGRVGARERREVLGLKCFLYKVYMSFVHCFKLYFPLFIFLIHLHSFWFNQGEFVFKKSVM